MEKNCPLITPIILTESLIHGLSCLRSPALSQVYLSLTFQLSQAAVVKVEMSSILASVSFWPLLIIELVARVVPERLIIR